MRDFSKLASTFWTGETGIFLRSKGQETQLIALYLLTCTNANMIGLYHLSLPTLCHETGSTLEGAMMVLQSLSEGGFAHYDGPSEMVFIPEMAHYQIGAELSVKDKRHLGVIRQLETFRKSKFYNDFLCRYSVPYHLPKQAPCKPHRRGRARAGAEQEQEKENEQEKDSSSPAAATLPAVRPRDLLFDAVVKITGADPKVSGSFVGKVCKELRKAEPPYTPEEVLSFPDAIARAGMNFTPTVGSILKHIGLVRNQPIRPGTNGFHATNGYTTNGQPSLFAQKQMAANEQFLNRERKRINCDSN